MTGKTSPAHEGRQGEVWRRYTIGNQTQQQIADDLGISQPRVSQILTQVRAQLPQETREDIISRRREQIDAVIRGHLTAAASGDKDATLSLIKLLERESKYLGLDSAMKVEATVTETTQADVALQELIAEAHAAAAAKEQDVKEGRG